MRRRTFLGSVLASLPMASRGAVVTNNSSLGGTVNIDGSTSGGSLPMWAASVAVNQWASIANTAIKNNLLVGNSTYTACRAVADGAGYLAYSGGAFSQNRSQIILGASGGGASAWPGTDIIGLDLTQNAPAWVTHVNPAPLDQIWPNGYQNVALRPMVNVGASALTVSGVNGFAKDEEFTFTAGTPPSPLGTGTTYYVVNASGYNPVTFQVSATLGGAAIALTDAGSSPQVKWTAKPHAWTKTGLPEPRHAYNQPHYIDQVDKFILVGTANAWETDSGIFPNVASWGYGNATWDAKGTYPNVTVAAMDNSWQCLADTTGTVYYASVYGASDAVGVRNPTTGVSTVLPFSGGSGSGHAHGGAFVDSTRGVIIWRGILTGSTLAWWAITPSVANGVAYVQQLTLTGPAAGTFPGYENAGYCCDPTTGVYYSYQDDGNMYALALSGTTLSVSVVTATGTPPAFGSGAGGSVNGSNGGIWNRMWYAKNLGGIAILINPIANVYFFRLH
jgi:hypothetical protein